MKTSQYASNIITAIDPRYIASLHGKGGCTFYRSSDLKRYACGMSRMFDAVPSRIVSEVRRCVQNCFTCRSILKFHALTVLLKSALIWEKLKVQHSFFRPKL